jgi:5-(carboxyamino)imidazole ribonucleotide mutase
MSNQKQSSVAVLMGSDSDLPTMESCIKQLKDFGIDPIVRMAAHLAGAMAAHSQLPIIGVPMQAKEGPCGLDALLSTVQMPPGMQLPIIGVPMQAKEGPCGLDALLSTVQMPPGMPVGTMAILSDAAMAKALTDFRTAQTEKVLKKDAELNA